MIRRLLVACSLVGALACVEVAPELDTLGGPAEADPSADLAPSEGLAAGAPGADGAHTPDVDPSAAQATPGTTLTVAASTGVGQRVVATLPSGRRVVLGADDVMPGGFRAQSPRHKVTAVYWVGR